VYPAAEVKELEEKGELDDADPLGAFFKKIFAGVRWLPVGCLRGAGTVTMCT
jgi:hypothetical protein